MSAVTPVCPSCPNHYTAIGTAAQYGALGAATVTNAGPTNVTGNVGVWPGERSAAKVVTGCTTGLVWRECVRVGMCTLLGDSSGQLLHDPCCPDPVAARRPWKHCRPGPLARLAIQGLKPSAVSGQLGIRPIPMHNITRALQHKSTARLSRAHAIQGGWAHCVVWLLSYACTSVAPCHRNPCMHVPPTAATQESHMMNAQPKNHRSARV